MAKKASANMWWIIIGAVIALVVMIILMVMFTGKTQPLEQGLSDCEGKGGVCVSIHSRDRKRRRDQFFEAMHCEASG